MSLDTILNIMAKWNLTADELLLLYLTFIAQEENGNKISYFQKWYETGGQSRLRDLFESLKSKGVIIKNYNPTTYQPDDVELNSKFLSQYFKLTGDCGKELWETYPDNCIINGQVVSLKNFSKKYNSKDDLYFAYAKTIKHSMKTHKHIIDTLKWAISKDLVNVSLVEFIISNKWEEYDKLRKNSIGNKVDITELYSE